MKSSNKRSIWLSLLMIILSWSANANYNNITEITPEETEGLIHMRQEEKMAHDVYLKLYEKWELPVFYNIAQSEQRHMNAILVLMEEFDIEDPVVDQPGVFSNQTIQELYNELLSIGEKSITDALLVGATIEDLDIADLDNFIDKTENERIEQLYQNLNKGSRNHLRTFTGFLKEKEIVYTPEYLSDTKYSEIISTGMERGRKNDRYANFNHMGRNCKGSSSCRNGSSGKKNYGNSGGGCMKGNNKGSNQGQKGKNKRRGII